MRRMSVTATAVAAATLTGAPWTLASHHHPPR